MQAPCDAGEKWRGVRPRPPESHVAQRMRRWPIGRSNGLRKWARPGRARPCWSRPAFCRRPLSPACGSRLPACAGARLRHGRHDVAPALEFPPPGPRGAWPRGGSRSPFCAPTKAVPAGPAAHAVCVPECGFLKPFPCPPETAPRCHPPIGLFGPGVGPAFGKRASRPVRAARRQEGRGQASRLPGMRA